VRPSTQARGTRADDLRSRREVVLLIGHLRFPRLLRARAVGPWRWRNEVSRLLRDHDLAALVLPRDQAGPDRRIDDAAPPIPCTQVRIRPLPSIGAHFARAVCGWNTVRRTARIVQQFVCRFASARRDVLGGDECAASRASRAGGGRASIHRRWCADRARVAIGRWMHRGASAGSSSSDFNHRGSPAEVGSQSVEKPE